MLASQLTLPLLFSALLVVGLAILGNRLLNHSWLIGFMQAFVILAMIS